VPDKIIVNLKWWSKIRLNKRYPIQISCFKQGKLTDFSVFFSEESLVKQDTSTSDVVEPKKIKQLVANDAFVKADLDSFSVFFCCG
jgi:hypothetical protein